MARLDETLKYGLDPGVVTERLLGMSMTEIEASLDDLAAEREWTRALELADDRQERKKLRNRMDEVRERVAAESN